MFPHHNIQGSLEPRIVLTYTVSYNAVERGSPCALCTRTCYAAYVGLEQSKQDNRQSYKKNNYNCCIHTVVPPDDGPRYTRNMQRLTKYSKNKQCINLVFLYTRATTVNLDASPSVRHEVSHQRRVLRVGRSTSTRKNLFNLLAPELFF